MIALALALAASQPGALKTFGDWTVGCDNGRACQAVALLPEEGDGEGATLTLTRGPEANAEPVVWVTAQVEGAQSPQQLVIDAKSLPLALDGNSERLLVRDGLGAARMLGQAPASLRSARAAVRASRCRRAARPPPCSTWTSSRVD
jgi:hypothetical protein